jgi:hypothetical protein
MKKVFLILFIAFIGLNNPVNAQKKFYTTSGGEMIFSFATIDNADGSGDNIMRWSPVFNVQFYGNYDFSKNVGLIFGAAIRNVGFIDDKPDIYNSEIKKKYRNYDFGLPVGLKVGNLDNFFFYGGYEIEFPFHYKEKTFVSGEKQDNKITDWFSKRTPALYHTIFAGVQLPYGLNVKVKYYISNFFNEDFSQTVDGIQEFPYQGKKANIIYFSLSFNLFKNYSVDYHELNNTEQDSNNDIY